MCDDFICEHYAKGFADAMALAIKRLDESDSVCADWAIATVKGKNDGKDN